MGMPKDIRGQVSLRSHLGGGGALEPLLQAEASPEVFGKKKNKTA
jgi:hypothetical protein